MIRCPCQAWARAWEVDIHESRGSFSWIHLWQFIYVHTLMSIMSHDIYLFTNAGAIKAELYHWYGAKRPRKGRCLKVPGSVDLDAAALTARTRRGPCHTCQLHGGGWITTIALDSQTLIARGPNQSFKTMHLNAVPSFVSSLVCSRPQGCGTRNVPPPSCCTTCILAFLFCLCFRPGECAELRLDIVVLGMYMYIVLPTVHSLAFIRYLKRCV